jgi:hypothetical protein
LFFKLDAGHFRLYETKNDPTPIYRGVPISITINDETDEAGSEEEPVVERVGASEFAYERDLRNFLAKHLSLIETGLRLYEEEGAELRLLHVRAPLGSAWILADEPRRAGLLG